MVFKNWRERGRMELFWSGIIIIEGNGDIKFFDVFYLYSIY
jgi:hypothetical protein